MTVYVLYHTTTGNVVSVTEEIVGDLTGDLARVELDSAVMPHDLSVHLCTFDGVSVFTESQAMVDASIQGAADKKEAARLMKIEGDNATAKEAKKTPGLSQGVIDELTKKEKP